MAEQNQQGQQRRSNLSVELGGRFFGYDPNPTKSNYSCVDMNYWGNSIFMTFTKKLNEENEIVLKCTLNARLIDVFSKLLEGMMARRRDAYISGKPYDTDDGFKIPITRWDNSTKTENVTGELSCYTELVDGESRVKLSFCDKMKDNAVIDIIFMSREIINGATGPNIDKVDLKDISAFSFLKSLKTTNNPLVPFIYNAVSSAVNAIGKMIRGNNSSQNNNGYNRDNTSSDYPSDYPF